MTDDPRNQMPADEDWAMERPPQVDAGVYPATLTKMTRKTVDEGGPDQRDFIVWEFAVDGGEDNSGRVEATSSLTLSARGKAYPWIVALVGKETAAGLDRIGPVERRLLIGRECIVNVIHNADGYAKVENVMPARKAAAAAPARKVDEPPLPLVQ